MSGILLSQSQLEKIKDNKKELINYAKKLDSNGKLDLSDFQKKTQEYLQSKVEDNEELSRTIRNRNCFYV
jgi:hypothetical protein